MEWKTSESLVDYPAALEAMERRVQDIIEGKAPEMVWLLEHPPLYTSGTSAKTADLLDKKHFPIYQAGRGGEWTYHGPGQRIAYIMFDLNKRGRDIRRYVQMLEQWLIDTLAHFGVEGFTREGRVGVWVNDLGGKEAKIAALGIRVRKWVSYHGIALNVAPDLTHYNGIVPCGISGYGVTSLKALGVKASMKDIDAVLQETLSVLCSCDGFGETAISDA
jgi:lipoyl(octanoyl) transferase